MHRQEELRGRQREHQLLLLLAGVAGDVHVVHRLIDHFRAQLQKAVDHLRDHLFVAGDGIGGDDDEITLADAHVAVAGAGHARQRTQRLALAARGDEHDLLGGIFVDLLDVDHRALGRVQIAQLMRHGRVVHHAAPRDGHLAPRRHGKIDDLLDAVHVRGERGDDDALFLRAAEQARKALAHLVLRGGETRALGVRRITQQGQHALFAVGRNGGEVGGAARDGRVVDLEIARVQDDARRTVDGEGQRIRDAVVHMDGLDGKAAQFEFAPRRDLVQLCRRGQAVLLELVADKAQRQARRVHGHVELAQKIRQRADVVLMAVRDDEAADARAVLQNERKVRDDKVDAEHVAVREHKAAVDQQHIVAAFVQRDVLAHFAQAAQRIDLHLRGAAGLFFAPRAKAAPGRRSRALFLRRLLR